MSLVAPTAIEYPETDGLPMGETDIHIDWIIRLRQLLRWRYREQRVYVASNLVVYYEEGQPARNVVPDGFVVLDCDPRRRRTFKTWKEKRVPNVVFEITSRGTQLQDERTKPALYAQIGVRELFLYDPTGEYLDPSLSGFRLAEGGYLTIEPNEHGALASLELGLTLKLEDDSLVLRDRQTGDAILTGQEAERAAREAAERRVAEESAARQAAEEEVRRLREQLKRQQPGA